MELRSTLVTALGEAMLQSIELSVQNAQLKEQLRVLQSQVRTDTSSAASDSEFGEAIVGLNETLQRKE